MKITLALCIILLSSCSSIAPRGTAIYLDKYSQYYLQAVPKDMWGQSSLQKLTVTTPQGNHELLLQTELGSNQINMVGLSAAGLVLFNLTWSDESGLEIKNNLPTKDIEAQVILAYYQLANWPMENIQLGLKNLDLVNSPEDQQQRNFFRDNTRIFSMVHTPQYNLMTHYIDHYQIKIETLQQIKVD